MRSAEVLGAKSGAGRQSLLSWLQALDLVAHPWTQLLAPSSGWLGPPVPPGAPALLPGEGIGSELSFLSSHPGIRQGTPSPSPALKSGMGEAG